MVNVVCWFAGVSRPAREDEKRGGFVGGSRQFFLSRLIAVRFDAPGTRAEDGVATFAASYRASRHARPPVERIELEFRAGRGRRTRGGRRVADGARARVVGVREPEGEPASEARLGEGVVVANEERGDGHASVETTSRSARERVSGFARDARPYARGGGGSSEERASRSRDGCLDVVESRRTTTTARVNDREARRRVRRCERTRREGLEDEACRCFLGERRGAWECGASWRGDVNESGGKKRESTRDFFSQILPDG